MEKVAKLKRSWNFALVLQIVQKIPEDYCSCLHLSIVDLTSLVTWWVVVQKIIQKCTLSHVNTHDVTDLVKHGMAKNTKTLYNWCLKWLILRSYQFAVEVAFIKNISTDIPKNLSLGSTTSYPMGISKIISLHLLIKQSLLFPFHINISDFLKNSSDVPFLSSTAKVEIKHACHIFIWFW